MTQPEDAVRVSTVDFHTGGEPFRIVRTGEGSGVPAIDGTSVADRRMTAIADLEAGGHGIDRFRRLLVQEPRGHADMYGGFLVPPDDDGADFGVVFWHKDGYSTACGHGTIALGAWAVEEGVVAAPDDGEFDVTIDVPSGRVVARVERRGGETVGIGFVNVASSVLALDVPVETSRGRVLADLSYGGAIYAQVSAGDLGLAVTPEHYADLVAIGREIKWALDSHPAARFASDDRLSGVYGTILVDDLGGTPGNPHQRNLVVFADGQADRSPCGSGTAARTAVLRERGVLAPGGVLRHDSIVGSTFTATAADGPEPGTVLPIVRGTAHRTGEHLFLLRTNDELGTGFTLR
ncbi:proline racemase [Pseudoclavibacter chungangensis]|uniref:Proline racemase n=1 Tax=Pseudoclavibacter chungangensis TaxID=587635 RepID=A0A7J5C0S4_9MICO|nr:proline racemase family protein [Pseudoclavibacter chungangensis]KAB1662212.1 proline racemase [Pseudoclavibacter chungangensis]NYJ65410.1 proline racemase [Pseudoclavibacter chungangensis]